MATLTVDTDGTSGTYSMMSAAEAALPSTSWGEAYEITCAATTGVADTTAVSFNQADPSAAYGLTVTYDATEGYHEGTWNTNLYRIETSANYTIQVSVADITFDGLQIECEPVGAAGWEACIRINAGGDNCKMVNCIARIDGSSTTGALGHGLFNHSGNDAVFLNCLVYSTGGSGDVCGIRSRGSTTSYNCTVYGCGKYGVLNDYGSGYFYACAIEGTLSGTTAGRYDYCATDGGTGTNAQTLDSTNNYGDEWTDVTTNDFTITDTSSVLYDSGYDYSGTHSELSTDIVGNTRTTDDIGCFAYVADTGVTVTGAVTIPAPTASATVVRSKTVTAAATVPAPDVSATVTRKKTVTASATIPAPDISATITRRRSVTAAATIPAPTVSATVTVTTPTGAVTVNGAAVVPAPEVSATVQRSKSIDADVVIPAPEAGATVQRARTATGSAIIPAPSVSATVTVTTPGSVTVTATATIPAPTVSATVIRSKTVTGAVVIPAPSVSATIQRAKVVTAAVVIPAPTVSVVVVKTGDVIAESVHIVDSVIQKAHIADSVVIKIHTADSFIQD